MGLPIRTMNANTDLRSSGTQNGAREITKDNDEQPKKLSDGEVMGKREMLPARNSRGQTEDVAGPSAPRSTCSRFDRHTTSPAHKAPARHKPSPAHHRRGQHIRGSDGEAVA